MTAETPFEFTVSAYDDEPPVRGVDQPPRRVVPAVLCLLAASLAVIAPFFPLQTIYMANSNEDGVLSGRSSYAFDGWGRVSVHEADGGSSSVAFGNEPRFGILYVIAASLLLAASVWALTSQRSRWVGPFAPAILGAVVLIGSVGTFLIGFLSTPSTAGFRTSVGPCPYLLGIATVLGLAAWAYDRSRELSLLPDPRRENELEPATAHPDTPTDLGSSPW